MTLHIHYAIASDRGLVRGNNEDSAYAGPHLIALADGMGGHAAGEIASQLMINHVKVLDGDPGDNDMAALLGSVADDGNRAIAATVRDNPDTDGMGTTLTALMFNDDTAALIHVGDSRGYRLRDGSLEQITTDDTWVQSLVDSGKLDAEDVSTHPKRSMLLKAYTGHPVEPTLASFGLVAGDRFLLCSDGLSDPVTHSTIEQALLEALTPQAAADRLIALALRSGGPDNVTVVVADVVDSDTDGLGSLIPVTPVTAGALNADEPENPRPDTAAGRAALVAARTPKEITPTGESVPQAPAAVPPVVEAPPAKRRRRWVATVLTLVTVCCLVAAGVWYINLKKTSTYFVTTASVVTGSPSTPGASEQAIVIDQGSRASLGTYQLHHRYQVACLDKEGRVSLFDAPADDAAPGFPEGCRLFTLNDIPPSARSAIDVLPTGSYGGALEQIQALASRALPACVTRTPATATTTEESSDPSATEQTTTATGATTSAPAQSTASTTTPMGSEPSAGGASAEPTDSSTSTTAAMSATVTTTAEPGDRTAPGVDCRKVD